jgi:D-alanine-D-alanine ligase
MNKIKLAILTGGDSSEREAALMGGEQVEKHINKEKYDYQVFDLPADNTQRDWVKDLVDFAPDCCFLALLGKHGEDGSVQGLLDTLGIAYCGSGVLSSAIGMDKTIQRLICTTAGIPMTEGEPIVPGADYEALIAKYGGLPVIVKPNANGSSIGVKIVRDSSEFAPAVQACVDLGDTPIIEKFVPSREMTCGVVQTGDELVALEPLEIKVAEGVEFYDYNAKYFDDNTVIDFAEIPADVIAKMKQYAVEVFRALQCTGYGRVDMLLDEDNGIHVLEINTLPGMTSHSLLPKAATKRWDYQTLLDVMIEQGMRTRR